MSGKLSPEQQEEFDRYAMDALSKMKRKRISVEDALREASIALVRAGRAAPGEGIDSESEALNVLRQAIKDERDDAVREIVAHHNEARAEIARLTAELAAARAVPATAPVARPLSEWHDDHGAALWWRFPIEEPPYCGSPLDDNWPDYHTHWTPIVCPDEPNQRGPLPKGG